MNISAYMAAAVGILFSIFFLGPSSSFAHSPHDVIFHVTLSPDFEADRTVFILTSSLLMSTDAGHSWEKLENGLDNAGPLLSLAISPAFERDGVLLVATAEDGIYRTEDKGKSWAQANSGLENLSIQSIHFSRIFSENGTVTALDGSGRLWESTDRGRSWMPLLSGIEDSVTYLSSVLVGNRERLVVGTAGGHLLMADDNANEWERFFVGSECGAIGVASVSPFFEKDGRIWCGCEYGGVLAVDFWEKSAEWLNQGLSDKNITALSAVTDSVGEITLYASSWDEGFFSVKTSRDRWEKKSDGLSTDPQAKQPGYMLPNFKGIASAGNVLFLGGFDGLFKSPNGGDSWQQLDTLSLAGLTALAVHAGPDSESHEVALGTYGAGAYLYNSSSDYWTIINGGLDRTRLNDILFSPNYSRDGLIFSAAENNFLRFEAKHGTWQAVDPDF